MTNVLSNLAKKPWYFALNRTLFSVHVTICSIASCVVHYKYLLYFLILKTFLSADNHHTMMSIMPINFYLLNKIFNCSFCSSYFLILEFNRINGRGKNCHRDCRNHRCHVCHFSSNCSKSYIGLYTRSKYFGDRYDMHSMFSSWRIAYKRLMIKNFFIIVYSEWYIIVAKLLIHLHQWFL